MITYLEGELQRLHKQGRAKKVLPCHELQSTMNMPLLKESCLCPREK